MQRIVVSTVISYIKKDGITKKRTSWIPPCFILEN